MWLSESAGEAVYPWRSFWGRWLLCDWSCEEGSEKEELILFEGLSGLVKLVSKAMVGEVSWVWNC